MAGAELKDRTHTTDAAADRLVEDPVASAGKAYLAELDSNLRQLMQKRDMIVDARRGLSVIAKGRTDGFRRGDLNEANGEVLRALEERNFARQVVHGNYRFTTEPIYAFAGHSSDPDVYVIVGTNSAGLQETLAATTTFQLSGESHVRRGSRTIEYYKQLGDSRQQVWSDEVARIQRTADVLYTIYSRFDPWFPKRGPVKHPGKR